MMRGHITEKILYDFYYDLTQRAKIDFDFSVLTVAAAVICALGFKMNSAPVIVGAMVISPILYRHLHWRCDLPGRLERVHPGHRDV